MSVSRCIISFCTEEDYLNYYYCNSLIMKMNNEINTGQMHEGFGFTLRL